MVAQEIIQAARAVITVVADTGVAFIVEATSVVMEEVVEVIVTEEAAEVFTEAVTEFTVLEEVTVEEVLIPVEMIMGVVIRSVFREGLFRRAEAVTPSDFLEGLVRIMEADMEVAIRLVFREGLFQITEGIPEEVILQMEDILEVLPEEVILQVVDIPEVRLVVTVADSRAVILGMEVILLGILPEEAAEVPRTYLIKFIHF